jgi:aspartyl-tRNA(Asn)/glutamyl-tRNA(Gln) amidotransferase subunit C
MAVTKKDVEYIANLAKLKLNETELENYTHDLNEVLAYMDKLNELDTSGIEPLSHPVEMLNLFREDKVKPSSNREEVLKNAPESTEEYFKVPKVISQ